MIHVLEYLDLSVLIVIIIIVLRALLLIIPIFPTDAHSAVLLLDQVVKDVISTVVALIVRFLII